MWNLFHTVRYCTIVFVQYWYFPTCLITSCDINIWRCYMNRGNWNIIFMILFLFLFLDFGFVLSILHSLFYLLLLSFLLMFEFSDLAWWKKTEKKKKTDSAPSFYTKYSRNLDNSAASSLSELYPSNDFHIIHTLNCGIMSVLFLLFACLFCCLALTPALMLPGDIT